MSTPALFIGGPWDGRRQVLRHGAAVVHANEFPGAPMTGAEPPVGSLEIIRHEYRHVPLPCYPRGCSVQAIYLHSSVPDLMPALVAGYREARQ